MLAAPSWARADDAPDHWSCVDAPAPGNPNQLELSWAWGDDEDLLPVLTLRTLDRDDRDYRLDIRLRFRGQEWTWSQDVFAPSPFAEVDVDLDPAELQPWLAEQDDWTSALIVNVAVVDHDGNDRSWKTAPFLQVVWSDGSPRLMTAAAAELLAPQGAWSAAAQASNPSAGDTDTVNEYGGESGVESGGEESP